MKAMWAASAFALGLWALAPTGALAAEAKQNFTLANETGFDIKEVYVSPHRSDDWEEDVLGTDVLADGSSFLIRFNRATKTCTWDLKVVYAIDDSNAFWKKIDLCSIRKITIKYNKKNDTTTAKFD